MALVADTGPLVALLDRSDPDHKSCASLFVGSMERRVIPGPVLPEVDYLTARSSTGRSAFPSLIGDVRAGGFVIEDLTRGDYDRVTELLEDYADLEVGFVDAAVLALELLPG